MRINNYSHRDKKKLKEYKDKDNYNNNNNNYNYTIINSVKLFFIFLLFSYKFLYQNNHLYFEYIR